jgi:hypothetical protein
LTRAINEVQIGGQGELGVLGQEVGLDAVEGVDLEGLVVAGCQVEGAVIVVGK